MLRICTHLITSKHNANLKDKFDSVGAHKFILLHLLALVLTADNIKSRMWCFHSQFFSIYELASPNFCWIFSIMCDNFLRSEIRALFRPKEKRKSATLIQILHVIHRFWRKLLASFQKNYGCLIGRHRLHDARGSLFGKSGLKSE